MGGSIMRQFRAWGLAATAWLGVGTAAFAVDVPLRPERSSAPPTTVFAKYFGPSKPKVGPVARGSTPPTIVAPLSSDVLASALRAEQEAWERRMSVCLKLRQVALDSNDETLMRQVDELERQATSLYNARAGSLGLPKAKSTPNDSPDEMKVAAKKLTAPATPAAIDSAVRTAEARTPQDVIREVRP